MSTNSLQPSNPLIITKRHIVAVSITTLMLSLFTGIVGYQVEETPYGLRKRQCRHSFTKCGRTGFFGKLLLEIEQTKHIRSDNDYQFVNELQKDSPISILFNRTRSQQKPSSTQTPKPRDSGSRPTPLPTSGCTSGWFLSHSRGSHSANGSLDQSRSKAIHRHG